VAFRPRFQVPPGAIRLGEGEKKMHPGMMWWWKARRSSAGCGEGASCGVGGEGHAHGHGGHWEARFAGHGHEDGGAFGVRRPLRFLAFKLDLDEPQVTELARILNDLKTERAQAAVDDRRTTSAFADALSGEAWDEAKVGAAAADRVKSAERLRVAVVTALGKIHALLKPEQRSKLAYLIRTGALSI
jgi:Spy/CpxP family protein refolding chaperone